MKYFRKPVLISIALLVSGCSIIHELATPYPTDDVMERRYAENVSAFESLVTLFKEDLHLFEVKQDGTAWLSFNVATTMSAERRESYRELLVKLKVLSISRRPSATGPEREKDIHFKAWHVSGFIIGGQTKYYVYKLGTGTTPVDSLDKLKFSGGDANASKKINEAWSLYLDIW